MSVGKFLAICGAALLLNLVGSLITKIFGLPIFFDTSGTILSQHSAVICQALRSAS